MKVSIVNSSNNICKCSGKHVPAPHRLYCLAGEGVVVYVCPTSYWNLVSLMEEFVCYDGNPPGSVQKHYSGFVKSLHKIFTS